MGSFQDAPFAPEIVEIERGYFRMGSDSVFAKMYRDETPARECSMPHPLAVGKYPVTFHDLLPFVSMAAQGSPLHTFVAHGAELPGPLPAVMISWDEAALYCEWLSFQTDQRYRLLTELEWEYACRAGTESNYWWGDDFDSSRANNRYDAALMRTFSIPTSYGDALLDRLTPVDAFGPNPWGLYDMLGNVWEWVEDEYVDRRLDVNMVTPRATRRQLRCLRGGSWMDPPLSLRSATRSWADPAARDRIVGWRVAREM